MDLASKLQLKPGQRLRSLDVPDDLALDIGTSADPADGLLVFVRSADDYRARRSEIVRSAIADRLTWVAYPKAGRLGTDLHRDRLAAILGDDGVTPVRQIAIDDTWSALRIRPA